MRVALLSLLAIGAVNAVAMTPAAAYDYPYCLQSREVGIPGECAYQTYAQCQASASGRYGVCNINPRIAFARQRGEFRGDGYPVRRDRYRDRAYRERHDDGLRGNGFGYRY